MRCYGQYCPIAHALDLVGERWSLLIVRELLPGPLRYSDLAARLDGIGTNILAARLKVLEGGGVIRKRRLPPPAASQVYELTGYGERLKPVLHELAHWGAHSLGPPGPEADLYPGWLENALRLAAPLEAPAGRFEFRIDDETASFVDGEAGPGGVENPDALVEGDPKGFFHLFVDRDLSGVSITGDRDAVERLVDALSPAGVRAPA